MDNKKLIAGFGYQEGRISSWDGKRTYTQAAPQMAKHCCDNGADEILIYDWSVTDDDHEAAIAVIKEVCREADAPVIAGGRVKRMEDVKKYLYAGASAVFLDMSKEENVDMIKEASDRFGKEKIYCIPAGNGYSMEELLEALVHVAKHAGRFVVFDLKSSLSYLKGLEGAAEEKCFDSIVAAYLLNPLKNDYGFEDVAQEHLGLMIDPKTELEKMVCYEAYAAFASSEVLEEKLKKEEMWKLFTEIEMPLVFTLFHMEQNGVRVEAEELKSYGEQLGGKIVQLEKEIYELAGEEFNINSPKQLGVVLFEHLSLPNGKKTKTGYSTAADVLDKLAPDYPIVAKILEYRQLAKLKSTYADGLAVFIHEDDHRIHGKFNQTVTATGRISSTEPNLQNIPAR